MPFIELTYRNYLDWYIQDAKLKRVWEATLGLQSVLDDKDKIPDTIFAGALNYTMCQLYRKADVMIAETITMMLFNKYFYDNLRYVRLMNAVGTLYSVRYAFREHLVPNGTKNTEDSIVASIDRLIAYQKDIYVEYEKKKRKDNGDLE